MVSIHGKGKVDGHAQREALGSAYWEDKRWAKVNKLREAGEDLKANGLVGQIRESWGVD
jgi:hypothetical protein